MFHYVTRHLYRVSLRNKIPCILLQLNCLNISVAANSKHKIRTYTNTTVDIAPRNKQSTARRSSQPYSTQFYEKLPKLALLLLFWRCVVESSSEQEQNMAVMDDKFNMYVLLYLWGRGGDVCLLARLLMFVLPPSQLRTLTTHFMAYEYFQIISHASTTQNNTTHQSLASDTTSVAGYVNSLTLGISLQPPTQRRSAVHRLESSVTLFPQHLS